MAIRKLKNTTKKELEQIQQALKEHSLQKTNSYKDTQN